VSRRGKPEAGRLLLYERSRCAPGMPFDFDPGPPESLLPVEGVHDADPAAVASAGDDGQGRFEGLPLGTYDVVVVAGDGRSASTGVWLSVDGERTQVRLTSAAAAGPARSRAPRRRAPVPRLRGGRRRARPARPSGRALPRSAPTGASS
jgi:hypothetical protein